MITREQYFPIVAHAAWEEITDEERSEYENEAEFAAAVAEDLAADEQAARVLDKIAKAIYELGRQQK